MPKHCVTKRNVFLFLSEFLSYCKFRFCSPNYSESTNGNCRSATSASLCTPPYQNSGELIDRTFFKSTILCTLTIQPAEEAGTF